MVSSRAGSSVGFEKVCSPLGAFWEVHDVSGDESLLTLGRAYGRCPREDEEHLLDAVVHVQRPAWPPGRSSCREAPSMSAPNGVQTIGRVSEARREPHPKARSLGSSGDASFLLFIPFCEKDHARLRQVFGNVP